jgi:hypothetical protein
VSEELLGTAVTGRCIVVSDMAGAWRPALWAIPFGTPAAVILWHGPSSGGLLLAGLWLGLALVGPAWALHRYRCRDDSLWDDGTHLMWARGGKVVSCVAWDDLVGVTMSAGKRLPSTPYGDKANPPTVPAIGVESVTRPSSTLYSPLQVGRTWRSGFGTLILVTRAAKRQAAEQFEAAVNEHGLPRPRASRPRTIREARKLEAETDPQ